MLGLGHRDRVGAAAARRALEVQYPDAAATEVRLRARETDRDVVAVLYRERQLKVMPRGRPSYRLFAVRRDHSVEEIAETPESPYSIRGIK